MVFAEGGIAKERLHMNSVIRYLDVALPHSKRWRQLARVVYFVDVAEED